MPVDPVVLRQLLETWRREAFALYTRDRDPTTRVVCDGVLAGFLQGKCDELDAALLAGAVVPPPPDPQVECPVCGEIVKQVASCTLNIALWQHWNWAHRVNGVVPPPEEGWQLIETAPKDGRLILLTPSRCWAEDANADCEVGYWEWNAWHAQGPTAEDYTGPTHWRPLPAPPVSAAPEGRHLDGIEDDDEDDDPDLGTEL